MFERFTRAARAVVVGAQEECRRLRHRHIGTEHLLLALLHHGDGAAAALRDVGVTTELVEAGIDRYLRNEPGGLGEEDAAALRAIGVDLDEVRARIEENFGPVSLTPPPEERRRWFGLRRSRRVPVPRYSGRGGDERAGGHIPFSPRSKKVLELSLREAIRLKHKEIAPEHVLLGLLRENGGLAAKILAHAGVDVADLRYRVEATLRAAA
jgi:ATP-dependent Clp protease ATP-binding subunit ClpA